MTALSDKPTLAQSIKLARESAYLGMYGEADVAYKNVIEETRRRIALAETDQMRNCLEGLLEELGKEKALTDALSYAVRNARFPPSQSVDPENRPIKKSLPFNKEPFAFHQTREQRGLSPSPSSIAFRRVPEVYISVPALPPVAAGTADMNTSGLSRPGAQPYKDPAVWDPAPPRVKAATQRLGRGPSRPTPPASRGGEKERERRRNYEKPWQLPVPPVESGEEKKSRYLLKLYPDGNGPDADLINMIESSVISQNLNTSFDDIAGLEEAKTCLRINVLCPLTMTEYFKNIRTPPKGILLYGPPGTGKTMLAKAIATTGRTTFLYVHPTVLASKWKGDSEKLVRILFEMARFYAPSTIFIDEIDSLLSSRSSGEHESSRKVKVQFFVEIDGVCSATTEDGSEPPKVFILAATNRPWDLDDAILRRLSKRVYIPLPNESAREQLFRLKMHGVLLGSDIDYATLVSRTANYNSDDIEGVCKEAAMAPFKRHFEKLAGKESVEELRNIERQIMNEPITMSDFDKALRTISPSSSTDCLQEYEKWTRAHGAL